MELKVQETGTGKATTKWQSLLRLGLDWGNSNSRQGSRPGLAGQAQWTRENSKGNVIHSEMLALGRRLLTSFHLGRDQTMGPASLGLEGAGREVAAPGSRQCVGGNYSQTPGFWLQIWFWSNTTLWPHHKQWMFWLLPWSQGSTLPSPVLSVAFILWFWLSHRSWTDPHFTLCV